jgi:hypothetical protein
MKWKDINGFHKMYQISSTGIVRSLDRKVSHEEGGKMLVRGKTIAVTSGRGGYYHVALSKNGFPKTVTIHRLVAEAFIKNTDRKPCVNHKDGNRNNNNFTNLEWTTYKENEQWSWEHLGKTASKHKRASGIKHGAARPVKVTSAGGVVSYYETVLSAGKAIGCNYKNIYEVLSGKRNKCGGCRFEEIAKHEYEKLKFMTESQNDNQESSL